jgi:hypothetical protein
LKSIRFEQSEQDPTLFSKRRPQKVVFTSSHVDDYLITGSDIQGIRDLKAAMAGRFKMKDMGHCVSYLGIEIKREGEKIHLCQVKYTT